MHVVFLHERREKMELFAKNSEIQPSDDVPLSERMRPASVDEMVGQGHLIGSSGAIRKVMSLRQRLQLPISPTGMELQLRELSGIYRNVRSLKSSCASLRKWRVSEGWRGVLHMTSTILLL